MSLRIGYVNVRGLSARSWTSACALLGSTFDLLFLAETWYADHNHYSQDRRVVATTKRPVKHHLGRSSGGIYLLATQKARSQIDGDCKVHDGYAISFGIGRFRVAGVYFEPSMLEEAVAAALVTLSSSSIILGDVNVRFRGCPFQQGMPGPPDRVQVFTEFLQRDNAVRLLPTTSTSNFNGFDLDHQLTTDHCFIRATVQQAQLRLLKNSSTGASTDHKYTLHFTVPTKNASLAPSTIVRYRVRCLLNPATAKAVCDRFDKLVDAQPLQSAATDVDCLNSDLVRLCCTVAEDVLGLTPSTPPQVVRHDHHASASKADLIPGQGTHAALRLYKAAARASQENSVLLPSADAKAKGISAIDEAFNILKARYQDPLLPYPPESDAIDSSQDRFLVEPFTSQEIADEIKLQDAQKACGSDGIHMRLLKALRDSSFLDRLQFLYRRCLATGTTPLAWNRSDIYLLVKDTKKTRTTDNVRPITLICMFRKVFERLLLLRFSTSTWAKLHPAQTGFRNHYSTCMNAAVVHHLLASKARTTAVFLDFRSAFDVVDHEKLATLLDDRGCPRYIQSLITSLMFRQVKSRVLANDEASPWFYRTRGVLQGSPLSPYLFNLFINSLLETLNQGVLGPPICLFYADDGCLVTNSRTDIQDLLNKVVVWSEENRIELNVKKCGHVSSRYHPKPLFLGNLQIPFVDSYDYLGFPMTARGIDFTYHLERRVAAAIGRIKWLSRYSDSWGPANRLRVYKQFLAPMFEYGAPLVWAWANESTESITQFRQSTATHKDLVAWIANSSNGRHLVTMNLCGLIPLEYRFQQLRTAFQPVIQSANPDSALQIVLNGLGPRSVLTAFGYALRDDVLWSDFKMQYDTKTKIKVALAHFLRTWYRETLSIEAQCAHLTALIPMGSRKVPGLFLADISLKSTIPAQESLFKYRRGMFMFNSSCVCSSAEAFHRGHEDCSWLPHPIKLTKAERRSKAMMHKQLQLRDEAFTDIDFLINTDRLTDAARILQEVQAALRQAYGKQQAESSQHEELDIIESIHRQHQAGIG